MTCAETYGYRREGSNPCKGIKRYRRRERFLSEQEVRRLGVVLKQHEEAFPMHVAIIRLLLLTGCRKQEITTLQWKEYRAGIVTLLNRRAANWHGTQTQATAVTVCHRFIAWLRNWRNVLREIRWRWTLKVL